MLLVGEYVSKGWVVHHADNSTTFLNGDIVGGLYVSWDYNIYNLHKILYGSKKSPRLRYKKLKKTSECI